MWTVSQQIEDYLEAIRKLEERAGYATTSALAREHRVAAPSVTEMLRRLSEQGLVTYEQRKGVRLTPEGRRRAASVVRRHRLWERFLHDVLGFKWDKVYDEACALEHATSPEVERRLAEALGNIDTCPHGHAIPGPDGETDLPFLVPLSELKAGQTARVVRVTEEPAELLRRIGALGIRPGVNVRPGNDARGEGTVSLWVGEQQRQVEREIAAHIMVVPLSPEEVEEDSISLLGDLAPGEVGVVRDFHGGHTFVARCLALGFTLGVEAKMVQNVGHGPVIVLVRDTRVALGRGEAEKIVVTRK